MQFSEDTVRGRVLNITVPERLRSISVRNRQFCKGHFEQGIPIENRNLQPITMEYGNGLNKD